MGRHTLVARLHATWDGLLLELGFMADVRTGIETLGHDALAICTAYEASSAASFVEVAF